MILNYRAQVSTFPLHGYFFFIHVFKQHFKNPVHSVLSFAATEQKISITTRIFIPSVLVTQPKLLNFTGIFALAY